MENLNQKIEDLNQILNQKIEDLDNEMLEICVKMLNNDFREGTEIVFDKMINKLEERLSEEKFIDLCNELYED